VLFVDDGSTDGTWEVIESLGTLALEELVLWAGIALLGLADMAVKVFAQALVIVGNYAISKWLVFGGGGGQGK
jgi:glycosyltransferase involved in cell wall biosynthesis